MKCIECDQALFSLESMNRGLCVECREGEYAGPVDLEDQMDAALNPTTKE